jgi:hypothetical protein
MTPLRLGVKPGAAVGGPASSAPAWQAAAAFRAASRYVGVVALSFGVESIVPTVGQGIRFEIRS